jgi:hypothetical protein
VDAALLWAVAYVLWRGTWLSHLGIAALAVVIVYQLNNGNAANALVAALVAGRLLQARGRGEWLGGAIAAAAAVKLTPVLLLVWVLLERDRRGLLGFAAASLIFVAVSLVGAGLENNLAYFGVLRSGTGDALPRLGLVALGIALAVIFRGNSTASFAILTGTAAVSTPAMGEWSLIFLVAALVPTAVQGAAPGVPRVRVFDREQRPTDPSSQPAPT